MVLDGLLYAAALLALAAFAGFLAGPGWAIPELLLAAFVLFFFRDPERIPPPGSQVISPADGRVVESHEAEIDGRPVWKIGIFLSIFDVHVNRSPITGVIRNIQYASGQFMVASRPEASARNEQNTVTVEGDSYTVVFKQVAGLIARRIVFKKKVGDRVQCGERVGLIKFGSRVDVFLPVDFTPKVSVGQHVSAGNTVLAVPATAQTQGTLGGNRREAAATRDSE